MEIDGKKVAVLEASYLGHNQFYEPVVHTPTVLATYFFDIDSDIDFVFLLHLLA